MRKRFRVIGQEIKKLREGKGWSQEYLACLLGIAQPDLANFEAGNKRPSKVVLRALNYVFGVSIDDLVFEQSRFYKKGREFLKE